MKITNKYNLPSSIYDALAGDDYDLTDAPGNVISATTLINDPKIHYLRKRHWNEIEVDASDRVWTGYGTAMHYWIELANRFKKGSADRLSEERWVVEVGTWKVFTLNRGQKIQEQEWYRKDRWFISGKFDVYNADEKSLEDYKVTSVWAFKIDKGAKPEWTTQLNLNAFALRLLGFDVNILRIIGICRDYSNAQRTQHDYPDCPIQVRELPIWDRDKVKKYILERVAEYNMAKNLPDDEIPECSPQNRWYRPGAKAVMKKGRKTAVRVLDTMAEAQEVLKKEQTKKPEEANKFYIEQRPSKNPRCEEWCDCNFQCSFWRDNINKQEHTLF